MSDHIPALKDELRAAMRTVAGSVGVVLTQGEAGRAGATVTAFTSVSVDPPIMLVCLNSKSRTAQAVLDNKSLTLNLLHQGQSHLADRFAGLHDNEIDDRFSGIDLSGSAELAGATTISGSLKDHHMVGTHYVILFDVAEVVHHTGEPLIWFGGGYNKAERL
jgi:flavin reductase